jgi:hypothetical protein
MTSNPIRSPELGDGGLRRATLGRVWMTAALIIMELGVVALAGVAWQGVAHGSVSNTTVWPITLDGGNAMVGIGVLSVIAAANVSALRAGRTNGRMVPARSLATLGQWLAFTRLVALLGAAVLLIAAVGLTTAWVTDMCLVAIGVFDSLLTVLVAMWTGGAASASPRR